MLSLLWLPMVLGAAAIAASTRTIQKSSQAEDKISDYRHYQMNKRQAALDRERQRKAVERAAANPILTLPANVDGNYSPDSIRVLKGMDSKADKKSKKKFPDPPKKGETVAIPLKRVDIDRFYDEPRQE